MEQSQDQFSPRNVFEWMRQEGLHEMLDLPQVAACGNQSVAKSSGLECITGIRFPTCDTLCTRFPVELVQRRGPKNDHKVKITPDPSIERDNAEVERIKKWSTDLHPVRDFLEIVKEASKVMNIDDSEGSLHHFSSDVLSIELIGPDQPTLRVIDLPGIFVATSKTQTEQDRKMVDQMVAKYMKDPRTIILAFIEAKDIHMQKVINLAKENDPGLKRTLGIVTKPDLLENSTNLRQQFITLLNNKYEQFCTMLGWAVLKGRNQDDTEKSRGERDAEEKSYLDGEKWQGVPSEAKGHKAFVKLLDKAIDVQAEEAAPGVLKDLKPLIRGLQRELDALEASNMTSDVEKGIKLACKLVSEAAKGTYNHNFFQDESTTPIPESMLKTYLTDICDGMSTAIQKNGAEYIVIEDGYQAKAINNDGTTLPIKMPITYSRSGLLDREEPKIRRRNTVLEFDSFLAYELFSEKAERWSTLASDLHARLVTATRSCLQLIIKKAFSGKETRDLVLTNLVNPCTEHMSMKLTTLQNDQLHKKSEAEMIESLREVASECAANDYRDYRCQNVKAILQPYQNNTPFDMKELEAALSKDDDIFRVKASALITCVEKLYQVSHYQHWFVQLVY